MKSSSKYGKFMKTIEVGSLWVFKHAEPNLIVKVFEVDKRGGVAYGLKKAVAGHITSTTAGFIGNYILYKSKEDKKWQWPI